MTKETLDRRRKELEQQMGNTLTVLEQRTGCENREAERLLGRWDELWEEYDQVVRELRDGRPFLGA